MIPSFLSKNKQRMKPYCKLFLSYYKIYILYNSKKMMLEDMITKGHFVDPQISRISENTFKFPLIIVLTLHAHEMVQYAQKTT